MSKFDRFITYALHRKELVRELLESGPIGLSGTVVEIYHTRMSQEYITASVGMQQGTEIPSEEIKIPVDLGTM